MTSATGSFPDPRTHEFPEWVLFDEYFYYARDIVCFGAELNIANTRAAYRAGIFPWHIDGLPLPWYCPEKRAILRIDELHVPRSLRKEQRKGKLAFTIDKAFGRVIENCASAPRSGEAGTWITPKFKKVYTELHEAGQAHSVEAWNDRGELVGGLYGVDADGAFCGESMFHLEPNASKLALLFLLDHLAARGAEWIDVQVITPHMAALGAKEIGRKEFLKQLAEAQARGLTLFETAAA